MVKKFFVIIFVIVIAGYFVGYHSVHAIERHEAQVKVASAQAVAAKKSQELTTALTSAWQRVFTTTPPDGDVDIAVYDNTTGTTVHYSNASSGTTYNTASIVKLSILETLLLQNQKNGITGLTTSQLSEATPMIENSDNDDATELWYAIGGSSAIRKFFQQVGATSSSAAGDWGLTQTTALDQIKVINQVAYPTLLNAASVTAANSLMDNIESDQIWGVTGGVPAGVNVELKNGWLQYNGWIVNSVGHVHGDGADYTIAVLTADGNSEQDGINTIQALSTAAWNTISASDKG